MPEIKIINTFKNSLNLISRKKSTESAIGKVLETKLPITSFSPKKLLILKVALKPNTLNPVAN